jgi:hypothetical protein
MSASWKVEWRGRTRWIQIGFPDSETEARKMFERACQEYPSDHLIRIREGEEVRDIRTAQWCLA